MEFFINRPVFAGALAMIMVVAGLVAAFVLPISQYPELVPPQVKISTTYTGASAPVVAKFGDHADREAAQRCDRHDLHVVEQHQ